MGWGVGCGMVVLEADFIYVDGNTTIKTLYECSAYLYESLTLI